MLDDEDEFSSWRGFNSEADARAYLIRTREAIPSILVRPPSPGLLYGHQGARRLLIRDRELIDDALRMLAFRRSPPVTAE